MRIFLFDNFSTKEQRFCGEVYYFICCWTIVLSSDSKSGCVILLREGSRDYYFCLLIGDSYWMVGTHHNTLHDSFR